MSKSISQLTKDLFKPLYTQGYSVNEIADALHTTGSTVSGYLKHEGIEVKKRTLSTHPEADIREVVKDLKKKQMLVVHTEPINCYRQGERCFYKGTGGIGCRYCLVNNKSRGGSPEECYKYLLT